MATSYEWDVERVEVYDADTNDIHDHYHQASYADCVKQAAEPLGDNERWDIVLVCDDDNGRSWAYVVNGKLPTHFEDAYGRNTRKVPKHFHAEVAKAAEAAPV